MDASTAIHWTPAPSGDRTIATNRWGHARDFVSVFRWGRTRQAARWLDGPGLEPTPALWPLREQASQPPLAEDHQFAVDPDRQTVTYRESGREVTLHLITGKGPRLDLEAIEAWRRADGSTLPVTDEEKVEVARRTLSYFRSHLGIRLVLV